MTSMDAEMRAAFESAVRTSTGYFYGVPEAVLARLVDMGIACHEFDEEAHQLTDKGWELGTMPDPVSPNGIKYHVFGNSRWQIPVKLVDPAPDTQAPGFPMVRPTSVTLDLTPNRAGVWCVSSVAVWGPKVKDGKVTTKREYSTLFSDLMNGITGAPEWLRDICEEWANRANGQGKSEAKEVLAERPARTPHREAFDSALNVLLIQENLAGSQWAIRQLQERADAITETDLDSKLMAQALRLAAAELDKALDERYTELSTREH